MRRRSECWSRVVQVLSQIQKYKGRLGVFLLQFRVFFPFSLSSTGRTCWGRNLEKPKKLVNIIWRWAWGQAQCGYHPRWCCSIIPTSQLPVYNTRTPEHEIKTTLCRSRSNEKGNISEQNRIEKKNKVCTQSTATFHHIATGSCYPYNIILTNLPWDQNRTLHLPHCHHHYHYNTQISPILLPPL